MYLAFLGSLGHTLLAVGNQFPQEWIRRHEDNTSWRERSSAATIIFASPSKYSSKDVSVSTFIRSVPCILFLVTLSAHRLPRRAVTTG